MHSHIKQLFIEALTDGSYQYGQGTLRWGNNCFCVMGVLCDLYCKAKKLSWWTKHRHDDYYEFDGDPVEVPLTVLQWAGLSTSASDWLIKLNDEGKSFHELASIITEAF